MKKQKSKKSEAAPESPQVNTEVKETKPPRFVVVREGYRVSDREYETPDDSIAIAERDFWSRIANKHSYGEPVEIVEYDSKRHRVW